MDKTEITPTEIDKAVKKEAENSEKHQELFYQVFLNTELHVSSAPNEDKDIELDKPYMSDKDTQFEILVAENGTPENDGRDLVYLFDTKERLVEFFDEGEKHMIGMNGYSWLQTLRANYTLVLNPDLPSQREFYADEIEWLLDNIEEGDPIQSS
jgi:hypothetical protein